MLDIETEGGGRGDTLIQFRLDIILLYLNFELNGKLRKENEHVIIL
jgi:hypothetical protein